jgi:hypothetical protein
VETVAIGLNWNEVKTAERKNVGGGVWWMSYAPMFHEAFID